ncbi:MAG TPA: biopolymer transporter ExbD [Povalibacter sp.]
MAMSARMDESDPIAEMNTTPLIDVLLVLLIMFIITLPLMTHSTTLQVGGTRVATLPEIVYVDIDFDGVVSWNGNVVTDLAQLESFFVAESAKSSQPDVQVRPDSRATYDIVARVLAIAQRSGIKRIGVGGLE